ncbi:MAG TPA: amidohydrolase family protein [Candidatus Binatia bacterium]
MVIDFEHHYVPIKLAERMGLNTQTRTIVEEDGVPKANVHTQLFDLDAQIQDMDRAGIDVAVQTCILGWDTTLENCQLLNNCAASIQKEYAERFVGLAHIPPLDGAGALQELERSVRYLQLKGVTISSQVRGLSLDAPEFSPFYEAVEKLRIPIFVHPALAPKGYDLLKDYQLSVILTREFDLGVAVTRLIAGGVLERYPELVFVISHFGGGLAGYKERIARSAYRFKLPRSFGDYFDRLYFDMAGFEGSPIALRCALEGMRPDRMVFATDYPQNFNNDDPGMGKNVDGIHDYITDIQNLPLDVEVKNDMLGGTAARLLKLNA